MRALWFTGLFALHLAVQHQPASVGNESAPADTVALGALLIMECDGHQCILRGRSELPTCGKVGRL